MKPMVAELLFACIVVAGSTGLGQTERRGSISPGDSVASRISLSAGMGVQYFRAGTIVDMITIRSNSNVALPEFKAGVTFFGGFSVPVSKEVAIKLDYQYLLGSYNVAGILGPEQYTVAVSMPSVVCQYIIMERGLYNLKVGAGGGYHTGSLTSQYFNQEIRYSASGVGLLGQLEANTALTENLFVYLGADIRWESIGALKDGSGRSPDPERDIPMHLIGAGGMLGLTYCF